MEKYISKKQVDKQSSIVMWVAIALITLLFGYGGYVIHITPLKHYFDREHSLERALDGFGKPDRDLEDTTVK